MEKLHVKNPIYPLLSILFSAVMLLGGLLISKEPLFAYLLLALVLFYLLFGYAKVLFRCLMIFLPLGALIGLLSFAVTQTLMTALQTSGRILLLGLCAVPLISTPPVHLTRSLTQIGCPRILTLGMLVAIRFVPVLIDEMKQILEAMKTRGVRLTMNISCFYRAFLIPLMMRIIGISEILSLSLETRGFDLKAKTATVYRPVRFRGRDAAFAAVASAMVVGMVIL